MSILYRPTPKQLITFGLWTLRNRGRDVFGEETRDMLELARFCEIVAGTGARGVNLHDNDLIPSGQLLPNAIASWGNSSPCSRTTDWWCRW